MQTYYYRSHRLRLPQTLSFRSFHRLVHHPTICNVISLSNNKTWNNPSGDQVNQVATTAHQMDNLLDALADAILSAWHTQKKYEAEENKKRQLSYRLQQLKDSLKLDAAGDRLSRLCFPTCLLKLTYR